MASIVMLAVTSLVRDPTLPATAPRSPMSTGYVTALTLSVVVPGECAFDKPCDCVDVRCGAG